MNMNVKNDHKNENEHKKNYAYPCFMLLHGMSLMLHISMLHIYVPPPRPSCMSILHAMPHVHTSCPCSMSMSPCCMSIAAFPLCLSMCMPHVHPACMCFMSVSLRCMSTLQEHVAWTWTCTCKLIFWLKNVSKNCIFEHFHWNFRKL